MAQTRAKAADEATEPAFTLPGVELEQATEMLPMLQDRLDALNDLALTLKHIHWNVVGPTFIGVHTMLDPQVDAVRLMADAVAERMAALGGSPSGTPGALVERRGEADYPLGRDSVQRHMQELNLTYDRIIVGHRECVERTEKLDPVTQDLIIGQTHDLEQFQWMVRAHLETPKGDLDDKTAAKGNRR